MIGYTIALYDSIGSSTVFFPTSEAIIYTTYEPARAALKEFMATINPTPILYGETFPYETTTFEAELEKNGFAVYGVCDYVVDGEPCRVPVGLKRVTIA
jgi:hypothetical protein